MSSLCRIRCNNRICGDLSFVNRRHQSVSSPVADKMTSTTTSPSRRKASSSPKTVTTGTAAWGVMWSRPIAVSVTPRRRSAGREGRPRASSMPDRMMRVSDAAMPSPSRADGHAGSKGTPGQARHERILQVYALSLYKVACRSLARVRASA